MSENCLNIESSPCPLNIQVYADTKQGGRNYMEDFVRIRIADVNSPGGQVAYLAVFDGHGGPEAARLAQATLGAEIARLMGTWVDDNDATVVKAIKLAFVNTHRLMNKFVGMWPKTISGLPSTAGTTASVVIIRGDKMYVGHVGDSTVVLGKDDPRSCTDESKETKDTSVSNAWAAQCLTTDHKPECPVERRRIEESGGAVIAKAGVHRVVWYRPRNARASNRLSSGTVSGPEGLCLVDTVPFLAVARALGDLWSYNRARDVYVVSPEPDVSIHRLDKSVHCVILASDGVWNMVSFIEAIETVQYCVQQRKLTDSDDTSTADQSNDFSTKSTGCNTPAEKLVSLALDRWTSKRLRADNTSAIVVIFNHDNSARFDPDALTEYCSDCSDAPNINDATFITSLQSSSVPFCQQLAELNFRSNSNSTREDGNRNDIVMEADSLKSNPSSESNVMLVCEIVDRPETPSVRSDTNVHVNSLVESVSVMDAVTESASIERSEIRLCENQKYFTDVITENPVNIVDVCSVDAICVELNAKCDDSIKPTQDLSVVITGHLESQPSYDNLPESVILDFASANDCAFPEFISDTSSHTDDSDTCSLSNCRLMPSPVADAVVLPTCIAAIETSTSEIAHFINTESLPPNTIEGNSIADRDELSISNNSYAQTDSCGGSTIPRRLVSSKKRKAKKQIMNIEKKVMHAVCSTMDVKRHLTRYHVEQIRVEQS